MILRLDDIKKYFPVRHGFLQRKMEYVKAVDGVSLAIKRGEIFGLVGESGSGKSTLGYTVVGIHRLTAGKIIFKGEDLATRQHMDVRAISRKLQIVFQDPGSSLNPKRTIRQTLELPLKVHRLGTRRERLGKLRELVQKVELPEEYLYNYPRALSGGQRQRIAIARALAVEPEFIVLDEPTSALDVSVQGKVVRLLLSLAKEHDLTYLFITHDLSLMRNVASRVAIMYLGKLCEVAPTSEFFKNPLHPYTKMLLSSIPVVSEEEESLKPERSVPKGEIPSPVNRPSGCGFRTRCPLAMDICAQEEPRRTLVNEEHEVHCHLFNNSRIKGDYDWND